MARPKGTFSYTGTLDGKTIYYDKLNGFVMRRAGGPSKAQIANSPRCEPVRQNNAEFKRAVMAASVLTRAFTILKNRSGDSRLNNRLKSSLQYTIKLDTLHAPGERFLHAGNTCMMQPVAFNEKAPLPSIAELQVRRETTADGLQVTLDCAVLKRYERITHYQLSSQLVQLKPNGQPEVVSNDLQDTEFISLAANEPLKDYLLVHRPYCEANVRIQGLAITFYIYTNGVYYPVNNAGCNAGIIVGL